MNRFRHRATSWVVVAGLAAVAVAGCQTTPQPTADAEGPLLGVQFVPLTFVSPIHAGSGYADLFSPEAYAVWVGPDVAAMKQAAAVKAGESVLDSQAIAARQVTQTYHVFECHLVSVFGDMSIAYDAVGLRNVRAYLMTPGGVRTEPVQVSVGENLMESPEGALKRYGRTCLLAFPKGDPVAGPAVPADAPSVRLVLEGYGSTAYFEWPATPAFKEGWIPTAEEYLKAVHLGFKDFSERTARFMHNFD